MTQFVSLLLPLFSCTRASHVCGQVSDMLQYTLANGKFFLAQPIIDDGVVVIVFATDAMLGDCAHYAHESVVVMDSTHGTNTYNYGLPTAHAIDEHGSRRPVMWAITSHKDAHSIATPLHALRKAMLERRPEWAPCAVHDRQGHG